MTHADLVLLVIDDVDDGNISGDVMKYLPANLPRTVVRNKIDLTGRAPGLVNATGAAEIALSVKTGAGLDSLRQHLKDRAGFQPAGAGSFSARRRHLDAIRRARDHLQQGRTQLTQTRAGELLAEELRLAQQALAEITGAFSSDDLLGKIFSNFCIGK